MPFWLRPLVTFSRTSHAFLTEYVTCDRRLTVDNTKASVDRKIELVKNIGVLCGGIGAAMGSVWFKDSIFVQDNARLRRENEQLQKENQMLKTSGQKLEIPAAPAADEEDSKNTPKPKPKPEDKNTPK